jgi:PTS system nitrogen regulatory IIA component
MDNPADTVQLAELIKRGGMFYTIPGTSPREVLTGLINTVSVPPQTDRSKLLEAVLEREALLPTAMGNGIALPHPRNPIITDPGKQFAAIAFLERDLAWGALDGKPVQTLILVVSASEKYHLSILSRLTYFCRQESFCALLKNRAPLEKISTVIQEAEAAWR